ncbi:glycosyltransferase family 4 protein [Patescibacteria group bacterium]|nr:glycosyltransferase family 4 protein [Patescibacteria group bacterium]
MKIAITVPALQTEETLFGQQIFAPYDLAIALADGLTQKGHEVFFYGAPSTQTEAHLVSGETGPFTRRLQETGLSAQDFRVKHQFEYSRLRSYFELDLLEKVYHDQLSGKVELVHHFHNFYSLFFASLFKNKNSLVTLHDPLPASDTNNERRWLFGTHKRAKYVSISHSQRQPFSELNFVNTVYNGINTDLFSYQDKAQDYFVFAGRYVKKKGLHTAIKVCREKNLKLKIAGAVDASDEYYQQEIKPYLGDNIEDLGLLSPEKMAKLLSGARALLFPIEWEEPFGLVMTEAMSCGTPVLAFNHGSVPEVVKDGKTGFICHDISAMMKAVDFVEKIQRKDCRLWVEENFSLESMVDSYLETYRQIIS